MDFIGYRKKLGIGFDNEELENLFSHRMWNLIDDDQYMKCQMSIREYYNYCMEIGYPVIHDIREYDVWNAIMQIFNANKSSVKEFLPYYIFFVNCQKDNEIKKFKKTQLINMIKNCLEISHIPYELVKDGNDYFIFPKGAKELDDALVSSVLIWLKEYPLSHKAFVKALKEYSKLSWDNASNVADLFRKALETFFKEFFESSKTLEHMKSEYGNYMESKGVPKELRNNFETLLQNYTNFMNGYAKHHDKTNKNILEYIMYQTGNLIRLLITLKDEDDE